jgi:hypothetical protein
VLALLANALAVGCTSSPSTSTNASASAASVQVALPDAALAVSEFPVGREWREYAELGDLATLYESWFRARDVRIQECMSERGFDYKPSEYTDQDPAFGRVQNPLNAVVAATYGYHVPPLPSTSSPASPDPAFAEALLGTDADPGGCAEVGNQAVGPIVDAIFSTSSELLLKLEEATTSSWFASSEYPVVVAEWAECMSARGFAYESPLDAQREFVGVSADSSRELQVRSADLECDVSVGLTERRSAFERKGFEAWAEENQAVITELQDEIAQASKELISIIGG